VALLNARPDATLRHVGEAHALLVTHIRSTPFDPTAASLLPDWTIGHVLTHIARNADSFTGLVETAARGDIGDQYPGGFEQRSADIERGAGRSRDDLIADVAAACARLETAFDSLDELTWQRGRGRVTIGEQPIAVLPARRWRETMIHHSDLGLGFSLDDFSDEFVDHEIPLLAATLPKRLPDGVSVTLVATDSGARVGDGNTVVSAPRHALLGWLIGRRDLPDAPDLRPW
jgi:maleylpyruvate isomerase